MVVAMSLVPWIHGAVDGKNHWSFQPLHKPKPPTIAKGGAIDQFIGDRKPGAYERMVGRYLNSPRYGER